MNKEDFRNAENIYKEINKIDSFIRNYKKAWSQGFLKKIRGKLIVGHRGYGYIREEEMECGKELSEKILKLLEERRNKLIEDVEKL